MVQKRNLLREILLFFIKNVKAELLSQETAFDLSEILFVRLAVNSPVYTRDMIQ